MSRAPRPFAAPLRAEGQRNGQWFNSWSTADGKIQTVEYKTYDRKIPMTSDEPLIFSVWMLLMNKVAIILTEPVGPFDNDLQAADRERARNEARGVAETLAILMDPFMNPPEGSKRSAADTVVSHAVKRFKDPAHEVPGLADHLWDPSKNYDGSDRVEISSPKAKPIARPKPSQVVDNKSTKEPDADEIAGMKFGLDSGMFTKEQVCSTFGVSMETLERVLA